MEHDPRAQRCCWWPRRQSPASSGGARYGGLAVIVSLNERAQPDAIVGGVIMLSSKLLKLLSSCSVLLHNSNTNMGDQRCVHSNALALHYSRGTRTRITSLARPVHAGVLFHAFLHAAVQRVF
jgi:hypothetical protein